MFVVVVVGGVGVVVVDFQGVEVRGGTCYF